MRGFIEVSIAASVLGIVAFIFFVVLYIFFKLNPPSSTSMIKIERLAKILSFDTFSAVVFTTCQTVILTNQNDFHTILIAQKIQHIAIFFLVALSTHFLIIASDNYGGSMNWRQRNLILFAVYTFAFISIPVVLISPLFIAPTPTKFGGFFVQAEEGPLFALLFIPVSIVFYSALKFMRWTKNRIPPFGRWTVGGGFIIAIILGLSDIGTSLNLWRMPPLFEKGLLIKTIGLGSFTIYLVGMAKKELMERLEIEKKIYKAKEESVLKTILTLVNLLEHKLPHLKGHSQKVSEVAVAIAEEMGLPNETIRTIETAALLHDIGKIGVDERILMKKGFLTQDEWQRLMMHTIIGEQFLKSIRPLHSIAPIVRHHHERWDGKGFPDKLQKEGIPLESRIISVADAFVTLMSKRSNGEKVSPDKAREILKIFAGSCYDPGIVAILENVITQRKLNLEAL